ncbi:hypothetical protein MN116_007019 [Schistosoma mekongi]|uniref:E3 ubiquitin-protein ligase LNX n=1 Tax=Schistosoma mekongi TaxID=38744 RepID=A0AAE1Z9P6_SCHME|nr:hypothetical protein MN116_007019 [Schistosoma mekongi]
MQTGSCYDDSTGSVGGDSETNTTVASSPGFDPPVTKSSPLFPEPPEDIKTQPTTYDNLTTFKKGVCKMEKAICSSLSHTTTIAVCDSSTPKSSKVACDASISNLFSNPPSFEPPSLPYLFSEKISPGLLNCPLNPATSTPSSFPSPRSAFTELHRKVDPCNKSVQPSIISPMAPKSISKECIPPHHPVGTSVRSQSEVSSCNPRNIVIKKYLCRACGQSHDPTSPHMYNYTQTVDADLCCTLCRQPLVDPLDTKCGHTFCSPCLKNHLAVQALCPVDRQIINYLECQQASNIVKRLLDKLLVACPNSPACDSIIYRSNLEEHLREWCVGVHSSSAIKPNSRTSQHNQFKNRFLSTFIGTEPVYSNMLQPIVTDSTIYPEIMNSQQVMKNNLITHQQRRENYRSSNNESDFSIVYPNQHMKEFPHIYPSITQIEMNEFSKANLNITLPSIEDSSDSPTIYEGIPVSILIYRPAYCMDLGFTFVGGIDTPLTCILIQEIYLDGLVATDGRLRPGDQLLEVNGNLLTHVTHSEARSLLTIPSSVVQLTVFREPVSLSTPHQSQPHYQQEMFYVKLFKRQGKVLGIKLVGKKHLPGLYVLELVAGCEADLDGRMKKDDRILEINGIDLENGTQEQAAQIINSVSDYVIFKISRRNRSDTPDILRATTDSEEKLENTLLAVESLQLSSNNHCQHNESNEINNNFDNRDSSNESQNLAWSSVDVQDTNPSTSASTTTTATHSTAELIHCSKGQKSAYFSLSSTAATTVDKDLRSKQMNHSCNNELTDISNSLDSAASNSPPTRNGDKQLVLMSGGSSCQERTIVVNKGPEEPLGISIAGGRHSQRGDTPIYVTNISSESVLGRSKSIQRGDILLEVNGVGLVGLTHQEAVEVLRQISLMQTHMQLRVIVAPETSDGPENFMPSWTYWLQLPPVCQLARVVLLRRETSTPSYSDCSIPQPLGFSIVGGLGHDQRSTSRANSNNSDEKLSKTSPQVSTKVNHSNMYPSPIVIKSIVPGLLAYKDGRLKCGDLILAVNNISMLNIRHSSAVRLLKQASGDVALQVISWPGTIV